MHGYIMIRGVIDTEPDSRGNPQEPEGLSEAMMHLGITDLEIDIDTEEFVL